MRGRILALGLAMAAASVCLTGAARGLTVELNLLYVHGVKNCTASRQNAGGSLDELGAAVDAVLPARIAAYEVAHPGIDIVVHTAYANVDTATPSGVHQHGGAHGDGSRRQRRAERGGQHLRLGRAPAHRRRRDVARHAGCHRHEQVQRRRHHQLRERVQERRRHRRLRRLLRAGQRLVRVCRTRRRLPGRRLGGAEQARADADRLGRLLAERLDRAQRWLAALRRAGQPVGGRPRHDAGAGRDLARRARRAVRPLLPQRHRQPRQRAARRGARRGVCVSGPGPVCGRCETCDGQFGGIARARLDCRHGEPASAQLKIRNQTSDARDSIGWKWRRGAATAIGEFAGGADYNLCMFDESSAGTAALLFAATVPGADQCGATSCWRAGNRSLKYKDTSRTPEGIDSLRLLAGDDGRASILVKGKGSLLSSRVDGLPSSPLGLPLRVQLQRQGGACWEATYSAAATNQAGSFKATSD